MSSFTRPDRIRYTAEIDNVREVTLYGTADLAFWQTLLHRHGLLPDSSDGAAHLVLSATALVWKGLSFRELIVTVATCTDRDQPQPDSFYLAHAFNSSRMLAWTERRLFNTPYTHADIQLNPSAPLIDVRHGDQPLFSAQMDQPKAPSTQRHEDWDGPVFLPGSGGKYFFVVLSGEQAIYPFAAADRIEIAPGGDEPIFQWLRQSHFAPTEWRIRTDATHARSKTYRRQVAARP
ncbi:MAG TPA: hypothetical protein VGD69_21580 [Herpetosiphonaceae bacterium]